MEARGGRTRRRLGGRLWVGSHGGSLLLILLLICLVGSARRKRGLNGLWNKPSPRFLWRGHDERRAKEKPGPGSEIKDDSCAA